MMKTLIVLAVVCTAYFAAADTSDVTVRMYNGTIDDYCDYPIATAEEAYENSAWNSSNPTVFIFHGLYESVNATSVTTIAAAYLERCDHNVLAVNYTSQSQVASWTEAGLLAMVSDVNDVGTAVGELMDRLVTAGVDLSTIHLVGYMTGAHAAGQAARTVNGTFPYVIGLDPLNWGFYLDDSTGHLNKSDATVVQVIHCNGIILSYSKPCGTVDFFPNSGYALQPGCWTPWSWYTAECSSRTCFKTYAESVINPTAFPAIACGTWTEFQSSACTSTIEYMGFGCSKNSTGLQLYLQTLEPSPYTKGVDGYVFSGSEFAKLSAAFLDSFGGAAGYLILSSWSP